VSKGQLPAHRRRLLSLNQPPTVSVLPNGSAGGSSRSKLPQSDQHGQCPLQFAIQVHFVSGRHIQILRGVGQAEGLISDCVAVLQLDNRTLVPFLPVAIDPGLEYVGGGRVGQPIIGPIRKAFLPLDPGILRASPPGGPKRGRPRVKPEGRLLTAAARDGRTIVRAGTEEWLRRAPN